MENTKKYNTNSIRKGMNFIFTDFSLLITKNKKKSQNFELKISQSIGMLRNAIA